MSGFGRLALIAVIVTGLFTGCGEHDYGAVDLVGDGVERAAEVYKTYAPDGGPALDPDAPPVVTLEEYQALAIGTPYEAVVEAIGAEGRLVHDGYNPTTGDPLQHYEWRNGDGSSARLVFSARVLSQKDQTGLK